MVTLGQGRATVKPLRNRTTAAAIPVAFVPNCPGTPRSGVEPLEAWRGCGRGYLDREAEVAAPVTGNEAEFTRIDGLSREN